MNPLTLSEITKFVRDWYKALDVHAPMVDVLPMLAREGLEMQFPEATLQGHAGFEGWYQRVIRVFFDEVHEVKKVEIQPRGDDALVNVMVRWEASVWNPPAARSERIRLDAFQRWIVRRSSVTGKPEIITYIVDRLEFLEGSARL
mgnify:CR=1 FL=1